MATTKQTTTTHTVRRPVVVAALVLLFLGLSFRTSHAQALTCVLRFCMPGPVRMRTTTTA
eukprot:2570397-Pyramimonas_sp.AAC.1